MTVRAPITRGDQRPSDRRVNAAVIAASALTGVSVFDIRSRARFKPMIRARWLAWRELRLDGFGYGPIANAWGCDHTTIMNAERQGWGLPDTAATPPLMIWGPRAPTPSAQPDRRAS